MKNESLKKEKEGVKKSGKTTVKESTKVTKNSKLPGWAVALIISISTLVVVFYAIMLIIFVYVALTDNVYDDRGRSYYNVTNNFSVLSVDKHYYDSDQKTYVLEGTVKNNTFKKFDDVEIQYYLYDENGIIISIARGFIDDIGPNETWHFKAYSDEDVSKIASYKLIQIVEDADYIGNDFLD